MRQLKITHSITNRDIKSLDKYLQDICSEELLTPEEEVQLAQRIKNGDQEALDRLTKANLRFVVLALVMMVLLAVLYMLAQGSRCPLTRVLPGILFSLCTWLLLSGAFALYVERVAHYAELYGSIATVVVVLLWLYISATMLVIGAEFNGALLQYRQEKGSSQKEE